MSGNKNLHSATQGKNDEFYQKTASLALVMEI